jgi:hypothetical protein
MYSPFFTSGFLTNFNYPSTSSAVGTIQAHAAQACPQTALQAPAQPVLRKSMMLLLFTSHCSLHGASKSSAPSCLLTWQTRIRCEPSPSCARHSARIHREPTFLFLSKSISLTVMLLSKTPRFDNVFKSLHLLFGAVNPKEIKCTQAVTGFIEEHPLT